MHFKKWAAPLLGISLSVLAGHALAGQPGFVDVDGDYFETIEFDGTLTSAPSVKLVPLTLKATRQHSQPNRLTTFRITNPTSLYQSFTPVSSDPFSKSGPRHYVDTLTLKNPANIVITLSGTVDLAKGKNGGFWTATDGSKGTFRVRAA